MTKDYDAALKEMGFVSDEIVQLAMVKLKHKNFEGNKDIIPIFSEIHGIGLASTKGYQQGNYICCAVISGERTPAARYINHSSDPNVVFQKVGDMVKVFALENIQPQEEFICDYVDNYNKSKGER